MHDFKTLAFFAGWGLRLADATLPIPGRVLPLETLHFGKGLVERVQPSADCNMTGLTEEMINNFKVMQGLIERVQLSAYWTRMATSKKCLTILDLDNWVLIYPAKAKSQSDAFYKAVMQQGPRLGIRVAIPQDAQRQDGNLPER